MQENKDILENACHQHNQRDIKREAGTGPLLAHRPDLIRIRRDGRSDNKQRRHMRDGPLDESHRPAVPQTNNLSALTCSLEFRSNGGRHALQYSPCSARNGSMRADSRGTSARLLA